MFSSLLPGVYSPLSFLQPLFTVNLLLRIRKSFPSLLASSFFFSFISHQAFRHWCPQSARVRGWSATSECWLQQHAVEGAPWRHCGTVPSMRKWVTEMAVDKVAGVVWKLVILNKMLIVHITNYNEDMNARFLTLWAVIDKHGRQRLERILRC